MKLFCPIILLLFSHIAAAQDKSINSGPPNLIVIKHKLGSIIRVDVSERDQPPNIDQSPHLEINPPRYEWRAKAQLQLRNTGHKKIKSIDWRLLVIVEENSTKQITDYFTHSDKVLSPGKTVTLERWVREQSLKTLKKQRDKGLAKEQAVIARIEYSDGTIWQVRTP
jgi:hypothetical protein